MLYYCLMLTLVRYHQETAGTSVPPILSELRTVQTPPTFHRTDKFTEAFQTIIDSYGIATYQEVNPGLFTVITFPFLFAVMFGDLGHGAIATMAAVAMIMYEKKLAKSGMNEVGRPGCRKAGPGWLTRRRLCRSSRPSSCECGRCARPRHALT